MEPIKVSAAEYQKALQGLPNPRSLNDPGFFINKGTQVRVAILKHECNNPRLYVAGDEVKDSGLMAAIHEITFRLVTDKILYTWEPTVPILITPTRL